MRADYLTYGTATRVSIIGLCVQGTLAGVMLAYAVIHKDHAAFTASWFNWIGVMGWLALAIVYDQHRRERIEAVETEALASTPMAGTSVFESTGEDFRPAAKRLASLYKFFLPGVSILIGGSLVGVGIGRLLSAREAAHPDVFLAPTGGVWGLVLGVVAAASGFVVARYAAGMAKQPAWANLSGGATMAVGGALLGLLLAVASFVDQIGPNVVVRYSMIVVPVFMILIGAEVLLNFLLGIYRPRRAGEFDRAAFDSRLLSLFAAPDRIAQSISDAINYQLGFNVTGGWMYRLLSRAVLPLLGVGLLVIWGLSSLAVVQPHQRAVVLRFGEVHRADVGPGLHLKAPWPIDTLYVPEYIERDDKGRARVKDRTVTGLRLVQIGTMPAGTADAILWTNDHVGEEIYQYVRTTTVAPRTVEGGAGGGTQLAVELADLAMVSVEIPLYYRISDVRKFDELAPPDRRDDLLRAVARMHVTRFFQSKTLEDVVAGNRPAMAVELQSLLQKAFDQLNPDPVTGTPRGAGVEIVRLGLNGVHPPKNTATSFESVVQADQRREANIEAARTDAVRTLTRVVGDVSRASAILAELDAVENLRKRNAPENEVRAQEAKVAGLLSDAGGSAAATLAAASAERWQRHMGFRGRAARYQGQLALYEAAPAIYKAGQYFDALKAAIEGRRLYIVGDDTNGTFQINLEDFDSSIDSFRNIAQPEGSQ